MTDPTHGVDGVGSFFISDEIHCFLTRDDGKVIARQS